MELSTVEIPRAGARETAAEYSRLAKRTDDPERRREYEGIARAYRVAARDEVPLIALTPTIAAGGTITRTLVSNHGRENERRVHYLLPQLAACRAAASFVYTNGIKRDGSIQLSDRIAPRHRYARGFVRLQAETFELPNGYEAGFDLSNWGRRAWSAMVPIVPPKHQPARGLDERLILWEVEKWEWAAVPPPPGDPALLRHVGGDIYAVEAIWDLTELEKLVLAGRRPES
jgi:hypothetical protein